jgi:hypothetical protein
MQVNTLNLANSYNVFLLENVFPAEVMQGLHTLCDQVNDEIVGWKNPNWTSLRKQYSGSDPRYIAVRDYLSSKDFTQQLEDSMKVKMVFVDAHVWIDYPGMGPLAAHCEQTGQGQGQIYISKTQHDTNGTAIMNDDKELLFTMPFRDNYGWYFDDCQKVMHSRPYDVVPNTTRASIIFWHNHQ